MVIGSLAGAGTLGLMIRLRSSTSTMRPHQRIDQQAFMAASCGSTLSVLFRGYVCSGRVQRREDPSAAPIACRFLEKKGGAAGFCRSSGSHRGLAPLYRPRDRDRRELRVTGALLLALMRVPHL
jgi:hypothetical protein